MPLLMMRYGGRPAISAPANRIEPADGASVPESMLKIVLLPEPFGPIRPRISPSSTLNDTLLTAVKPPNRLTKPSTTSTTVPSPFQDPLFVAVGRARRQRQHGVALRLALRPDHIRLVVDVLDDHRERALVLAGHRRALAEEFDAEAEHGAAFRKVGIERSLAQGVGIDAAVLLDGARQHVVEEDISIRSRHADMRRADRDARPDLVELVADHLDDTRQLGIHGLLVGEPDRDRIGVEQIVRVRPETFLQLLVDAVTRAMADDGAELQALFAGLPEEQRDVGIVAGVEDHVGPGALQFCHQRGEIGSRGGVPLLHHDVEAGFLGADLVTPGHVNAVSAVLVDDG